MTGIKLAVLLDQEVYAGGGFQDAINNIIAIKEDPSFVSTVRFYTTIKANLNLQKSLGISISYISINPFEAAYGYLLRLSLICYLPKSLISRLPLSLVERTLLRDQTDLVYFLQPSTFALELDRLNYIITVWDLCHLDHPEFPEVRIYREHEKRQNFFNRVLSKSFAVIVDSPKGKQNIEKYFHIPSERVHVISFKGSIAARTYDRSKTIENDRVKTKYKLNRPYIFYPAQYWPHKNHAYILHALKILKEEHNIQLGAVFCGSNKGNLEYLKGYANELEISSNITFLGFVPDDDITSLYANALCLVMPTYFGPTNLPPLEANIIGTPVIYSDSPAMDNSYKASMLKVQLDDPTSLANQIKKLYISPNLRAALIQEGLKAGNAHADNRIETLTSIINTYSFRRRCWP